MLMILAFTGLSLTGFSQTTKKETKKSLLTETVQIKTSAQCDMCKMKIEGHLNNQKGVRSSSLDLKTATVTVKYNPERTDAMELKKAIAKLGYDADEVPADAEVYKTLPDCCQK